MLPNVERTPLPFYRLRSCPPTPPLLLACFISLVVVPKSLSLFVEMGLLLLNTPEICSFQLHLRPFTTVKDYSCASVIVQVLLPPSGLRRVSHHRTHQCNLVFGSAAGLNYK
jgi:hypothetical protein